MTTTQIKELSEAYLHLCQGTAIWAVPLAGILLATKRQPKLNMHSPLEIMWYISSIFGISCLTTLLVQYVYPPGMVLGGATNPIFRYTPHWVNIGVIVLLIGMAIIGTVKLIKRS